ncbi:MAG: polysaccharide deacetylase family protein [Flavobacteriaceae bacterium]|nr:polysaccharide deacetylase family protein [Bacteroidia bacterium]MBT8288109.1 polysaccharide deacetylase family protein [Bacteroidia bacterium]NNF74315.1 polysaccharide deacetylase family protein [Flavobacteriaceae bacterium]NNK72214.1 polysaccharide deacetylase family protein [Flavobacteriaceae bacterium]
MSLAPVKTPSWLKRIAPHLIWHIPTTEKSVYLTFDDGPTPGVTDWTLDLLQKYRANATFFCVGSQVAKYPELFERIQQEGHSVGNHSENHLKGWSTPTLKYVDDVSRASKLIRSKLFRPPYGQIRPTQVEALKDKGFDIVMWSILSKDWDQKINEETCANNVIDNTTAGDIIVFHDSLKARRNLKYALPLVLEDLMSKGFEFKCIPEPIR